MLPPYKLLFFLQKVKTRNLLECQRKFKFFPLFFKMFTKHIFIDDAIAAFKPYSGIATSLMALFYNSIRR